MLMMFSPNHQNLITGKWLYSKIAILKPYIGLPESGLISEVVLISNIALEKYHLGLVNTSLNSEVILILGGLNREILLYYITPNNCLCVILQ